MYSVYVVPAKSPSDVSGIQKLIDAGTIQGKDIIAVLGKTEGNGCVNDWTRGYSVDSLKHYFGKMMGEEKAEQIIYVMSGGTEGVLSPHFTLFCKNDEKMDCGLKKSLAIGVSRTPKILPEELGRVKQVELVAAAVREAMANAGISDPADVHFVQIKCPLLTSQRIKEAAERGNTVVTEDTYKSMGYSRGASALGVAVALGEIPQNSVSDGSICHDWSLFSKVASTSAGIELMECEIILFGNAEGAGSCYYMEHDVMQDSIDADAVMRVMDKAELGYLRWNGNSDREFVYILAKAESDPTGYVRGRRNTMNEDSDINHTRHARAVVGGVLASIVGDPMIYVSGGGEHQGPAGGGPVAVIGKVKC